MGVKFFGQFLLERGAITREQLLAATELQNERNRPLGAIAVEKGYLSAEQAARINTEQQTTDRRFGELALELGLMTAVQMDEVLRVQRDSRIRIGEAMVAVGCLTEEQLTLQLSDFQIDQAIYQTGRVELPANTPHPDFVSTSVDLTEKMLLRVGGLTAKRGLPVPIDDQTATPAPALLTLRIPFSGALRARYVVSTSRDVALNLAERILGESTTLSDELALDALKEFCNIVTGNVCAKHSREERPLEIGPPEDGLGGNAGRGSLLVPLHLPDGQFELRLLFD
jgi:CheY-specific phosphatase CheX